MPFFGSLLARAARLWWYSSAEIPGVRSPGAIRCGCVSWSGCPNWHSAADTSVLMAGSADLLRNAARGLGRHACMLACRGRNRLLLMVVGIERAQGSAANHRNAQVRSPCIGCLSLRTAESRLALRSLTSSMHGRHFVCLSQAIGVHVLQATSHKAPLRHIAASCMSHR